MSQETTRNSSNPPSDTKAPEQTVAHPASLSASIVDALPIGVFVFDDNCSLTYLNKVAREFCCKIGRGNCFESENGSLDLSTLFLSNQFPGWARRIQSAMEIADEPQALELSVSVGRSDLVIRAIVTPRGPSGRFSLVLLDETATRRNQHFFADLAVFASEAVMASYIAHDVNNFLSLFLGAVEMSQLSLAKGRIEKVENYLEKMHNNVGKMEAFTTDLTRYTHLKTSEKVMNLNELVSGAVSHALGNGEFCGVRLSCDLSTDVPDMTLRPEEVALMLLHLLTNAAEAVTESGRNDGYVDVRTRVVDNAAVLAVTDNGVGMEPDVSDKLFVKHLTTKEGHLGYGLVSCARVFETHQATFQVESEPGQGTTITVTFPIAR